MNVNQQINQRIKTYEKTLLSDALDYSPLQKKSYEHDWIKSIEPLCMQLNHVLNQEIFLKKNESSVQLHRSDSPTIFQEKEAQLDLELTKLRMITFGQGFLLSKSNKRMSIDLPLQIWACLRAVQRIAHFYGFSSRSSFEAIYTMRILNYSFLPSKAKLEEWNLLAEEMNDARNNQPLYFGKEDIVSQETGQVLIKQVAKWAIISQINHSKLPGKRFLSGVINAGTTYRQVKTTTIDSRMFYSKRWLIMNT
ncbi:hypothetical protein JOC54_001705 [Alkalihalobacillus xiaoxiensis]|uniref:EcsC family protein n=1 Tax=Shouchella xiaoxiensis TaxID=766895 RepID=A0ABS2SVF1_9BACI|nr:EcsC family protein [Shouchella xiaoxiensis]MBM7838449.1 hypothetical protein [Shouchella xiaoxiensis]